METSIVVIVLAATLDATIQSVLEAMEALTEVVRAFFFKRTHNYRNNWKP